MQEELAHYNLNNMKTVLNKKTINPLTQPMFLGEDMGLQRYDKIKYPIFMELWKKQWANTWHAEEISLIKDRNDYEEMTEVERHVFESNLRWQTMTDSMLSRSIHKISEYITNPELELCCGIWSSFESIHSHSYTWILQNITKDASSFFDSILDNNEIVNRADQISSAYDKLLGNPSDLKTQIFNAILNTNITEGLNFYTSFACSYYFGHRGKMEGSVKNITLIARDENIHFSITQNIFKYWKEREDEGFQKVLKDNEQKVYDTFALAVQNEKNWADYLFSKGSLLGLNAESLKGYVEWLANSRLVSLGYKKIYDQKKNPIGGWLDSYGNSSKVQVAPQETEITSYLIGAGNVNISDSAYNDIEL